MSSTQNPTANGVAAQANSHGQKGLAGLIVGRDRRGLRRHRHQPAVHAQAGVPAALRAYARPCDRARRAVAGVLGADDRGHAEVRHDHHARRQRGRGRHHGADGAGPAHAAQGFALRVRGRHPRDLRRLAVLRRRRDHAGSVRAVGDRRPGNRRAAPGSLDRADHRRDPAAAVPQPAPRDREGRQGVRAGHDPVVLHHRSDRRVEHRQGHRRSSRRSIHGGACAFSWSTAGTASSSWARWCSP